MSGIDRIAAERARQVAEEGWTTEHDDGHADGALARAAACYALPERLYVERRYAGRVAFEDPWPWNDSWDKRKESPQRSGSYANHPYNIPTNGEARIRMLVRAGALIAAEIDRLERAEG